MIKRTPKTYFTPAILVTLFGFSPIGFFAIRSSIDAKMKYESGDYRGAVLASKKARNLCIVGATIAGLLYISVLAIIGHSSLSANNQSSIEEFAKKLEPLNINCHMSYHSHKESPGPEERQFTFEPTENKKTVSIGDFALNAEYLSRQSSGETQTIQLSVAYADSGDDLVSSTYQIISRDQFQDRFPETYGFTGLGSFHNPGSQSKLQYWCEIL